MFFGKKEKPEEAVSRRQHPRVTARNLVKISRPDGNVIDRLSNIFDLSSGGLRIVCHEQFPLGTLLEIELNLPERGANIRATGKIVWIKAMKGQKDAYFAGLQFTNLAEQDRRFLDRISGEGRNKQDL